MQRFPCLFCGLRDEHEFHFVADAGKVRPEGQDQASAENWAQYLYVDGNPKGASDEAWLHLACGEFFTMRRNTVTHVVASETAP